MKSNVWVILREAAIAVALIAVSAPVAAAVCGRPWMASFHLVIQLSILVLLHLTVTCVAMMICGVRKWWKLAARAVGSGVVALAFLVAVVATNFKQPIVFAKIAAGEGGFVHEVGEARMHYPGGEIVYSVYWGNVKYANGSDMRELILISKSPESGKSPLCRSVLCEHSLLVGRSRILAINGLSVAKCFPGCAAVTCLGGIDIKSGKIEGNVVLSISDSGAVRRYLCEMDDWIAESRKFIRHSYILEVPLSCFKEMGDDVLDKSP